MSAIAQQMAKERAHTFATETYTVVDLSDGADGELDPNRTGEWTIVDENGARLYDFPMFFPHAAERAAEFVADAWDRTAQALDEAGDGVFSRTLTYGRWSFEHALRGATYWEVSERGVQGRIAFERRLSDAVAKIEGADVSDLVRRIAKWEVR